MSFILGLVGAIVSALVSTAIIILSNGEIEVSRFSLFFIVPVGAMACGFLPGFLFFKSLVKRNKKIELMHMLLGLLLGLITLIGIEYGRYHVTAIQEDTGDIYYSWNPGYDHVGEYELEGYGELTFLTYEKLMIETSTYTFSNRSRDIGEVSNTIVSWIFTSISFIGVLLGAIFYGFNSKSNPYCSTCSKYKKNKEFKHISQFGIDAFFEEIEAAVANLNSTQDDLLQIFNSAVPAEGNQSSYYKPVLVYCEECNEGSLVIEKYNMNSKKQFQKDEKFIKVINLTKSISGELLNI